MAQARAPEVERPIVVFDFDGTMTIKDSFSAFLRWRARPLGWWWGLIRLIPAGLAYLVHRDRGRIKIDATREFLAGTPRTQLESEAQRFFDLHAQALLRPDAVSAFKVWRRQDIRLVIVTASPDVVVAPFLLSLGGDEVVGTILAYDEQDRVSGDFATPNCRGLEKLRRLKAAYGPEVRLLAAYGDTRGDAEMLEAAEKAFYRVFRGRP